MCEFGYLIHAPPGTKLSAIGGEPPSLTLTGEVTIMKTNIGSIDKILRIVVGLALIVAAFTGFLGVWAWIGVVPLATALMGWCPAYTLFGISTCPVQPKAS